MFIYSEFVSNMIVWFVAVKSYIELIQLPKPKQETRWEAFAKLKGIKKKKKEKMVWDEVHRVSW